MREITFFSRPVIAVERVPICSLIFLLSLPLYLVMGRIRFFSVIGVTVSTGWQLPDLCFGVFAFPPSHCFSLSFGLSFWWRFSAGRSFPFFFHPTSLLDFSPQPSTHLSHPQPLEGSSSPPPPIYYSAVPNSLKKEATPFVCQPPRVKPFPFPFPYSPFPPPCALRTVQLFCDDCSSNSFQRLRCSESSLSFLFLNLF